MKVKDEAEWSSSRMPRAMLKLLEARAKAREIDRKLRLFACSCVRQVGHLLDDERSWKAVETAERYADGVADREELREAHVAAAAAAGDVYRRIREINLARGLDLDDPKSEKWRVEEIYEAKPESRIYNAADAACSASDNLKVGNNLTDEVFELGDWCAAYITCCRSHLSVASLEELAALHEAFLAGDSSSRLYEIYEDIWQADRLRCIFGNPFRPAAFDDSCLTPSMVLLARAIYDDRAFERMPILGDALHDAGCHDDELLAHCRGPAEHGRGCWALDLIRA